MQIVMLVVQILIAVALIGIILVQRTSQDGGGLMGGGGGGTMGGLFTARGSANLLTRATAVLATLFILNSLALGYIASHAHQSRSAIDQFAPQNTAPVVPATPNVDGSASAPQPPQVPVAK